MTNRGYTFADLYIIYSRIWQAGGHLWTIQLRGVGSVGCFVSILFIVSDLGPRWTPTPMISTLNKYPYSRVILKNVHITAHLVIPRIGTALCQELTFFLITRCMHWTARNRMLITHFLFPLWLQYSINNNNPLRDESIKCITQPMRSTLPSTTTLTTQTDSPCSSNRLSAGRTLPLSTEEPSEDTTLDYASYVNQALSHSPSNENTLNSPKY